MMVLNCASGFSRRHGYKGEAFPSVPIIGVPESFSLLGHIEQPASRLERKPPHIRVPPHSPTFLDSFAPRCRIPDEHASEQLSVLPRDCGRATKTTLRTYRTQDPRVVHQEPHMVDLLRGYPKQSYWSLPCPTFFIRSH